MGQGRHVHKGDWVDALPLREKEIFFLLDSTTRPSDLTLNVIVESGNSQAKKVLQMTQPLFGVIWGEMEIAPDLSH